jgi:hypothetical protein
MDSQLIYCACPPEESVLIQHDFDDSDNQHLLEIALSGKLPQHTKIDDQGCIVEDQYIEISDVSLDGIEIHQIFLEHARYRHDFNGAQAEITDQFFGVMGCNGVVSFAFSGPVYLWLLENM